MTTDPHVCTCGDCEPEAFSDRCKYEATLRAIRKIDDEMIDRALDAYRGVMPRTDAQRMRAALAAALTETNGVKTYPVTEIILEGGVRDYLCPICGQMVRTIAEASENAAIICNNGTEHIIYGPEVRGTP